MNSQFSNNAGPASLYASMPLKHDMIGLYFAVGNANHLPPWGGLDMLLSTNPIAAAIPAGTEKPIVLDMATTVAAYGKVKTKALRGEMMNVAAEKRPAPAVVFDFGFATRAAAELAKEEWKPEP